MTYAEKAAEIAFHVGDELHFLVVEDAKKTVLRDHGEENLIGREGELVDAAAADRPASNGIACLFGFVLREGERERCETRCGAVGSNRPWCTRWRSSSPRHE